MRRRIFCLLLLMLFLVPSVTMAATIRSGSPMPVKTAVGKVLPEISNVRWWVHKEDGTSRLRLVFDTTAPVQVSSTMSENGDPQLTVDINGAAVGKISPSLALDGDIADQATISSVDNDTSRITINLTTVIDDGDFKVFTLRNDPANHKPFRVVVDINKPAPKIQYNFTPGLAGKTIVLDPGHGGTDSGAIGLNNTMEKTITLAVAQKVQALLEKAGAKVIMTRTTDVDVYAPNDSAVDELSARAQVGNKNKADLFLSIHNNAFSNREVGGTATYYYQKTKYDALLAQCIQNRLVQADGLLDRGTYPARFYVIKHTVMPAALTELAFISNPKEEKMLNDPQVQQQMAQGIVTGIDDFFRQASQKGGSY